MGDYSGTAVVLHVYDALGNHQVIGGNVDITTPAEYNNHVGNLNPFRYRSYYFDTETGLYYLQSRYYDPVVGRFLNADDVEWIGTFGKPLETNLFIYCCNNCVNKTDEIGHGGIDTLLGILNSCIDILVKIVTLIGNSQNGERKKLEASIKLLTKKQRNSLADIKALQKQTKKLSKALGWIGCAIAFIALAIGFASAYKTSRNVDYAILETVIELFVGIIEGGAGELFSKIANLVPYVGFLLGLIAGWVISYILSNYFNSARVKRIKNKFTSLTKNKKVSLTEWVKYAVQSLNA